MCLTAAQKRSCCQPLWHAQRCGVCAGSAPECLSVPGGKADGAGPAWAEPASVEGMGHVGGTLPWLMAPHVARLLVGFSVGLAVPFLATGLVGPREEHHVLGYVSNVCQTAAGRRRGVWTNGSGRNRVKSAQSGDGWEDAFWDGILEAVAGVVKSRLCYCWQAAVISFGVSVLVQELKGY